MTWKLTDYGKTRVPLMGVEWRDLSDAEFAAAETRHPELRERGYFEQAAEAATNPEIESAAAGEKPLPTRRSRP